jgi:hypothetical protein
MKILRKPARANTRGRFTFLRALDVLHIYTSTPTGTQLYASIEPLGGVGCIRIRHYRECPFAARNGIEALNALKVLRRFYR